MKYLQCAALLLVVLWLLPFRVSSAQTMHVAGPSHQHFASEDASAPRALVLEPFATELALGPTAGQPEVDALVHAGFQVDVYRDSAVTIPVIESMARYDVVYMESHSGTCGPPLCTQNDVFVLTGVQVTGSVDAYASLFADGSLTEGSADTNPGVIYLAFTSRLISQHVDTFANSSIVFFNGCDLLAEPTFLHALMARGAASIYTWNKKVFNFDAEPTADFIFGRLSGGESVTAALADAHTAGLGTSLADEGSTLELFGDPEGSFARAHDQATPTPTPTATSTPTPTLTPIPPPTATPTARATAVPGTCKKGHKRVRGKCVKVPMPVKCKKGYRAVKGTCKKVGREVRESAVASWEHELGEMTVSK